MKHEPNDPIQHIEKVVKDIHDTSGKITQPVLKRYPLLFAFLVVFSLAAILHGFELASDQVEIFREHPLYLIGMGILALFLTGTLYKELEK